MSGLIQITVEETRGFVAIPADVDRLAIVMGCASGLPASTAGLKAATATVAAPVTLTVADLLAAGIAALLANPRHLTFTTAGATPSDAPASVTITGLIAAANGTTSSGSEVLALSQAAAAVTSVNRYKTITSLAYLAADGTGATIAIGYDEGAGLSPFYLSGSAAVTGVGYGDAVDTLTQVIEQRLDGAQGTKYPAALFTIPAGTAGSYGTVDVAGMTGTVVPTPTGNPYGTYRAAVRVIDDGNDGAGASPGTAGITYQWALDYDGGDGGGDTWSRTTALGTAYSISIPNSAVTFDLEPPAAQVTALIAAAVEARADTLAHLADLGSHLVADTSADQVALAASGVPATEAEAWAVLNLCRAAYATHRLSLTAHQGVDPVNVVSHAAATSGQTGIELYTEYKTDYNAHLGIALAEAPSGLRVATATVAAPVTVLAAALLAPGLALMAVYPRRVTFTTAGATPSDAPATATVTGTDYADAALVEVVNLSQIAGQVDSAGAFKTIVSIAFAAGDGVGATIAIGYGFGVHGSADAVNTLSATTPTHGTLFSGDVWHVRTLAPVPGTADIADAFTALAFSAVEHALLVLDFPLTQAMVATVSTGLNALDAIGRKVTCLARTRLPDFEASETEAAWLASVAAEFLNESDSRIHLRADYGLITDAMTSRQYRRSLLSQVAADAVRVSRSTWLDSPADRLAGMPNVTLIDAAGNTVGHDEGPQGSATGLSNDTLGNRFGCVQRLANSTDRQAVYTTVPWVFYASDERIRTLMLRRLANAMERVAVAAARPLLGRRTFYQSTGAATGTLIASERAAIHGSIFRAVSSEFADELLNGKDAALDTGLVQVDPSVTVAAGRLLGLSITLAPIPPGYTESVAITFTVQE